MANVIFCSAFLLFALSSCKNDLEDCISGDYVAYEFKEMDTIRDYTYPVLRLKKDLTFLYTCGNGIEGTWRAEYNENSIEVLLKYNRQEVTGVIGEINSEWMQITGRKDLFIDCYYTELSNLVFRKKGSLPSSVNK